MPAKSHGMSRSPEYFRWKSMKARCHRETNKDYPYYSSKGIEVCEEWREDFLAFLNHIGEIPKDGKHYTLDRIDNNKGYEPNNVRWATQKEQTRNINNHSKNKSGVVGVSYREDKNGIGSWVASWHNLKGKCKSKQFSTKKYGDELAFFAACECREQMIELLNKNGAGYGEGHITKLYEGDL